MIKRIKMWKIQTQFAAVLIFSLFLTFLMFELLWTYKWLIYGKMADMHLAPSDSYDEEFWINCAEEALKYDFPEKGENEKAASDSLKPFFNQFDEYTGVYIYGLEDGYYRAGKFPEILEHTSFSTLFGVGYQLTDGIGEFRYDFPMQFKNGYANVLVTTYYRSVFVAPYLLVILVLCAVFFVSLLLFFISCKLKHILVLEDEVLLMSSGNLTHTIPDFGEDEIGILARELNNLRMTLNENILREQESRKANQDLITAMSHDLRTPLTILNGYLEVLHLNRNPKKQEEYLERCLKKTADIKEMTDRMFEYALIYEETETFEPVWISTDFIRQCLVDNCDFIQLTGFSPEIRFPENTGVLKSDKTMLKRIFNNLFSNILKYGDKKGPVTVTGKISLQKFTVTIVNFVKQDTSQVSGNNIGLKNVEKMMKQLNGKVKIQERDRSFLVELSFPLK